MERQSGGAGMIVARVSLPRGEGEELPGRELAAPLTTVGPGCTAHRPSVPLLDNETRAGPGSEASCEKEA